MTEEKRIIFLEGQKVILRPFNKATDLKDVTRWMNDPEVRRWVSGYLPVTENEEEEWFDNLGKNKDRIAVAIEIKKEGSGLVPFLKTSCVIANEANC